MNDNRPTATAQTRAGLLESMMLRLFTRGAHVLDIEAIGNAFRVVTLGGDALRNTAWTPGDKIQIQLGGWIKRTYTPMDWDAENGRTRILVHLHAAGGPGTQWARELRQGDACVVFGPRRSVDLTRLGPSAVLFGDETSFGLAAALLGAVSPSSVQMFFEVSSLEDTRPALEMIGLDAAQLRIRRDDKSQLIELEEQVRGVLKTQTAAGVALTGNAESIQHMRRLLRELGVGANRFQTKAYWKPGKTGLD